jgi:ferric-dicitrate binding protein FerR (iron transport regulator)
MVTTTDVSKYISWKDGAIIIDSNSLQDVMSKLADYYNVEIVCSPSVSQLRCSGRLVLFDNIGQTLNVLTNIIPIGYRWADDKLYITEE